MANPPIPSWYEGQNNVLNKVTSVVSYGTVDADTVSPAKTFYFWNNRAGQTDVAKMEDVTFTVRDRNGGLGDTQGNIVEAVRDNWFEVRCDSLSETTFVAVGKGGTGTSNPSGLRSLGTTGTTKNVNADTASAWSASAPLSINDYVKPTVGNGFIYKVTVAGVTDATEPTWLATEGLLTEDGTVKYVAVPINKTPASHELLGLANNVADDGSDADDAGGNFAKLSVQVNVPINASSGRNLAAQRVN